MLDVVIAYAFVVVDVASALIVEYVTVDVFTEVANPFKVPYIPLTLVIAVVEEELVEIIEV